MDVTRYNFEESLDALQEAIDDPDFAFWSFDCEFTGLNVGPNTTHDLLDTPEERFQKVHQCVRAFTVLQVGVAIFAFDPTTRRWTCRPFNFWTIPDAKVGKGVFASQASSLQFLVECGFDLNKCVGKGIPFVPASERSKTEQRRAQLAQRPPIIPSSDRDIAFVRDLLIKVTDWLTRSDNDEEDSADGGWNDDLCLDPTNGFLRALTYQILERDPVRFGGNNDRADPGFIACTSRDFADGLPRIVLSRATKEEVATHRATKEAEERKKDQMKEGFGIVLAKLGACGRPCVGHNAMFDCVYIVDKFLAELDGSFEGFKREFDKTVRGAFYDTKLIAQRFMDGYLDTLQEQSRNGETAAADAGPGAGDPPPPPPPPPTRRAPLDTALGPLYRHLTSRPLPPMWTEDILRERSAENEDDGAGGNKSNSAGKQWRGDGGAILDWISFPDGFQRYDSALRILPNNTGGVNNGSPDVVANAYGNMSGSRRAPPHSFGFEHEAGYDAYMTGVCFLTMVLHSRGVVASEGGAVRVFADPAAMAQENIRRGLGFKTNFKILPDRNGIGKLGACVFSAADGVVPLQRSDMSHMSLRAGYTDVIPDRGHVYFLVGATAGTTTNAIAQLFAAAGLGSPLHIVFVGRGTVRVIMHGTQYAGMSRAVGNTHYAMTSTRFGSDHRRDPGATVMRDALRTVGMGIEVLSYGEWTRAKADEREAEMANAAAAAADLAAKLARSTRTTAQISAEVHANVARAAQRKQAHRPGTNFFGFGSMLGPLGKKRTRETARAGGAGMFPPPKKSRATGGSGCVVM